MKIEVFAVLDAKIGSYAQPFFSPTIASALRAFVEAARDTTSTLGKHPEDFQLYHLSTFDDETGEFTARTPTALGTAASFINN